MQNAVGEAVVLQPGSAKQLPGIVARHPNLRKLDLYRLDGELCLSDCGPLSQLRCLRKLRLPGVRPDKEEQVAVSHAQHRHQQGSDEDGSVCTHGAAGVSAGPAEAQVGAEAVSGLAPAQHAAGSTAEQPAAADPAGPAAPHGAVPQSSACHAAALEAAGADDEAAPPFYAALQQLTSLSFRVCPVLSPSHFGYLTGAAAGLLCCMASA